MRQFIFFLIYWLITVAAFMPRPSTDWLCVSKNNSFDGVVRSDLINEEFENLELGNLESLQRFSENETESDFLSEDNVLSPNGLQLVSFSGVIYVPQSICPVINLTQSDLARAVPVQRQRCKLSPLQLIKVTWVGNTLFYYPSGGLPSHHQALL